jgi:CheY-like chemotaxis protein
MDKSILLVDDLAMFIEIEKEFLQYTLVDIATARDGLEALNLIKTRRPDIVFMDLEMPKMDGATCCRTIKSDPALINLPVVMVTSKEHEEKCRSAGCDHFLTKPLDRDAFLDAARKFIPEIDRREKRLAVNIDCTLHYRNKTMKCALSDVSRGGAFVVTDQFGAPGSVVQIRFTLPDGSTVDCSGRIAWVNKTEALRPQGFGVKFALLAKDSLTALRGFLDGEKRLAHSA